MRNPGSRAAGGLVARWPRSLGGAQGVLDSSWWLAQAPRSACAPRDGDGDVPLASLTSAAPHSFLLLG